MLIIKLEEPVTEGEKALAQLVEAQIARWQHNGPYLVVVFSTNRGREVQIPELEDVVRSGRTV